MPSAAQGVVVREANGPVRLEEIVVDEPGPGEVLVRVLACGVCHSDLLAVQGHRFHGFPLLLGHEAVGVVEAVGLGVSRPLLGERVLLAWRAPCGECRFCLRVQPQLCVATREAGPRLHARDGQKLTPVLGIGSFCTHTVVAAAQALPVREDLAPESLCLIGCGVMTGVGAVFHSAAVRPGSTVVVFGCGGVGMNVIQGARLAHARTIIGVDIEPRKLVWARQFGATAVVNAREDDAVARVKELTGGHGVDYAFEVVGRSQTLRQALACLDRGGTAVLIGLPLDGSSMELPLPEFFMVGGALRASRYGDCLPTRDFPVLVDWYRTGALKLDELVSEVIGLEDVPGAFARMERGETLRSVVRL